MRRSILLVALAAALPLLITARAAALDTATIDPALLPPDPAVVSDADLAGAGASPVVQQLADGPNLIVVDDDLAQCPNAEFTTAAGIQAAIEAAPPGGRIRVCPGNYTPINVHKADLWLQAPRTHGNANQCREANPAQDAIIEGTHVAGLVQIVASGVRFEGFIVQGNSLGPGVRTDSTGSGYELVLNEVRANQYGIDLNTNAVASTLVEHNCVRDNTAFDSGVLSSTGFSDVTFEHNFFTGHNCVSISNLQATGSAPCAVFTPPVAVPAADVVVEHNSFVDDTTVDFIGASDVVIAANEWLRPFGASVILDNTVRAEVSFNHIDGQSQALSQGIFVFGDVGLVLDVVIKSNKVEHLLFGGFGGGLPFFGTGISVNGTGVLVETNWVEFNRGTGIWLRPRADFNTVRGNLVVGNGVPGTDAIEIRGASDGIRANLGAIGNVIENNRLGEPLGGGDPAERANREHDCHDTNPQGANMWRHNVGYTENQPGLCVRPA